MVKKIRAEKKTTLELFEAVNLALERRKYVFTYHAKVRSLERRNVTQLEVLKFFKSKNKHHEKRKDFYSHEFETWNYSLRGKIEEDDIRIIISFDDENMLIITVINLCDS